ncbi:MarR family transcriptional regulator [Sphingomonas sp. H39-1-10]|uniref:MarR family winged helix-turn-helix transcriptional regulator n=1 Tax=Sphingomonas TaxID=13687 RepID=UPI0008843982|nr:MULTISPECIES: MarR family transcriptional regulator [Sphingomonas]MDF0487590.1 MarR family transcriptional regulator [Sphingomonas pollutisoli]SDA16836.1 DNA-binding transcriptional regulator, MarR family [Sphingomonas sp. NFR15]
MTERTSPARQPGTAAGPNLDEFLCFAVYSTGLAFNRVYKPLLDPLGLTYPQYLAMVALWQEDNQMVSQLGEKLFLESNTLTPLIKRLEAAGFVTRRRDTKDERVVRVSLTPAGRALAEAAACLPEQVLKATGITPAQLETMRTTLTALRTNLRSADTTTDI